MLVFPLAFANTPNWAGHGIRPVRDKPFPSLMNTQILASERPFSYRLALAKSRTASFARRTVANAAALLATELAMLAVALLAAGFIRQWVLGEPNMVLGDAWVVLPLYVGGAALAKLVPGYGLGAAEQLRRLFWTLLSVFGLTVIGIWLAGPDVDPSHTSSRLSIGLAGAISIITVPLARTFVKAVLVRLDAWGVPVVVYGAGRTGAKVIRQLQEERGMGYVPVAVFDDDRDRWGDFLDTVPIVGGTDRVTTEAAIAFLAMPGATSERQIELLEGPLTCYSTVVVIPDLFDAPSLWVKPRDLVGVLGLEITSNLTRPLPQTLKRLMDLLVAVVTAPVWVPLVLLSAGLGWLEDRKNPFFRQQRVGKDGEIFHTWKLRTMVHNADAVLECALEADPDLRAEWDEYFKLEKDPRITRIGRFLRKTSLDELPQLINVLRGEMSLVGPRPLPQYHQSELCERVRELRERVRPGITGLWQVSGRSDAGTIGMERWDPYYVRNWSLWLDFVILVRTAKVVLRGSGAY